MNFSQLNVENFGPFQKANFEFAPAGITLVSGPNGSGKSQLVGAILFSLFGRKVVDFVPAGALPCIVELSIEAEQLTQTVTSIVASTETNRDNIDAGEEPDFERTVETTDASTAAVEGNLDFLASQYFQDSYPPNLFSEHDAIGASLSSHELNILRDVAKDNGKFQQIWDTLAGGSHGLQSFDSVEALSAGPRMILALAFEYAMRWRAKVRVPLVLDGIGYLGVDTLDIAFSILDLIGEQSQVILTTTDTVPTQRLGVRRRIDLKPSFTPHRSAVNYVYGSAQTIPVDRIVTSRFVLNQAVQIEEGRQYEFKEVKGSSPVRTIVDVTEDYVVAFLNAEGKRSGTIFWGIRDSDYTVAGVPLTLRERDEIVRVLSEKLNKISPWISSSTYRIETAPVFGPTGPIPDQYVVTIVVPPGDSRYLYATGSNEIYLKTDGGKQKLSALQIQQELLRRRRQKSE